MQRWTDSKKISHGSSRYMIRTSTRVYRSSTHIYSYQLVWWTHGVLDPARFMQKMYVAWWSWILDTCSNSWYFFNNFLKSSPYFHVWFPPQYIYRLKQFYDKYILFEVNLVGFQSNFISNLTFYSLFCQRWFFLSL